MANHEGSIRCFWQRSCSKNSGHPGKCDKRFYNKINNCFRETSKPQLENASKKLKEDIELLENNKPALRDSNYDAEIKLNNIEFETCEINSSKEILNTSLSDIRIEFGSWIATTTAWKMLNHTQFSRTKRELNPTTFENINDSASRTHYNSRIETKNILVYIHGGLSGGLFGAWDFILGYGDETLIEKFIVSSRRGKFIEKLYGKFTDKHLHSEDSMKRALSMEYQTFMPRRKFEFICKIKKRSFDIETQEWRKNSITYDEYNLNLKTASVSNRSVELFVRSLDIGDVSINPGISGVLQTITGLTTLK